MTSIADIRKDYSQHALLETSLAADPLLQFGIWWEEALKSEIEEVNAMTLATASREGVPAARIVLLKGFDQEGFIFYTNYKSNKANDLEENPRASLVFFWKELERQVRITGSVEKLPGHVSEAYFNSRPEGSRIGAWASPQSKVISSRDWIETRVVEVAEKFNKEPIPRPDFWGGYLVRPVKVEFWQGRSNRLHDRILYTGTGQGNWKIERLAP